MKKFPARLDISAFDEDEVGDDDHIGTGFVRLGKQEEMSPWEMDDWIDVMEKAGRKKTGQVRVCTSWAPEVKEPEKPLLGKMVVTIFEASDLKSVDTFGKNDVYAAVTTGGMEKRTVVHNGAGDKAVWNRGAGEQLTFDLSLFREHFPPPKIEIVLNDENTGEEDLLIGSYTIDLKHKSAVDSLKLEKMWYDIQDRRGKPAGLVQLEVEWTPDPDNEKAPEEAEPLALEDGSLKVTIIEAADLKQMDTFGMNDVFCTAKVSSSKDKRTSTIKADDYAERGEPQWGGGKGETLSFRVKRLLIPASIQLIAMDEDADADDHIGTGFVNIDEELHAQLMSSGGPKKAKKKKKKGKDKKKKQASEKAAEAPSPSSDDDEEENDDDDEDDDAVYDEWVPIKSVKGKPTGRVRVRVHWKPKIYSKKELAAKKALEENTKLEQVWASVDENHDEVLSAQELKQVLLMMGMPEAEIDMFSIMSEIDLDRSGEVDFDELRAWWVQQEEGQREAAVTEAKASILAPAALTAEIISARQLKRMDVKGNDVFVTVTPFETNVPKGKHAVEGTDVELDPWRSSTIYSSQHSGVPVWPKGEDCTWDFLEDKEMPLRVKLAAFDEDRNEDDMIGAVEIDIAGEDSGRDCKSDWQLDEWHQLRDAKNKKAGEVNLRLSWVPKQKSKEELRKEAELQFFAAVVADDVHTLRLLLARGVDPNCVNHQGLTPMELAKDRRKRRVVSFLEKATKA